MRSRLTLIITIVDHTINDELKDVAGKGKKMVALDSALPPVKKAKTAPSAAPPKKKKKTPSTGGKTPTALQKLVNLGTLQEKIRYGSSSSVMDAFVLESVTPSPDHEYQDESDSM
ncbi:hypothetical protein Tco_0843303 [Tanacetum coccineum]|uniref:Uncharacterized protein n=1 Tax=Tanacetum coccineum TaxID=301880 RepID=A0ABQ5B1P3_9ASTR